MTLRHLGRKSAVQALFTAGRLEHDLQAGIGRKDHAPPTG
jgi:hypothetical protein